MSMGWLTFGICSGVGVWLWLRWQRERNKPINRLRRQARQAADEIRERVPTPDRGRSPSDRPGDGRRVESCCWSGSSRSSGHTGRQGSQSQGPMSIGRSALNKLKEPLVSRSPRVGENLD